MSITSLVEQLKDAGQDFEFYPTDRQMIRCIWEHCRGKTAGHRSGNFGDVLDIGCGTCNFKRYVDEFNAPLIKREERSYGDDYIDRSNCVNIHTYYVMEKSRILLDKLDAETIVLGTDFHTNTLIDKPVDTIFCNPPYSEYEEWVARIIKESVCDYIYFIIPERWKNSEKIKLALETVKTPYNRFSDEFEDQEKAQVIGSFDFLDAERAARAKVDIVFIDKSHTSKNSGFDSFFDEVFGMEEKGKEKTEFEEKRENMEGLKNALAAGKNKIEILCEGYAAAQQQLFEHFQVISGLDADILETIGIHKDKVKIALKSKFTGLKNLYWQAAFDCLDEITGRLTSTSRSAMLDRFAALKTVDFTAGNVYALILWVIKNANQYYTSQMVDFFKALSSKDNIQNYVSNKRFLEGDDWRYYRDHTHYTLDYRIICTRYALPGGKDSYYTYYTKKEGFKQKIQDICTVANNLGFTVTDIDIPEDYGKKGYVYMNSGKAKPDVLFEFKCYQNDNVHVKFNIEFMKALNVEVARELGWIHSREDIAREFVPEMAEGAEKYFDRTLRIDLTAAPLMLGCAETPQESPEAVPEGEIYPDTETCAGTPAKGEQQSLF